MGRLLIGFFILSAVLIGYVVVICARSRQQRERQRAINADAWASFCLSASHAECASIRSSQHAE